MSWIKCSERLPDNYQMVVAAKFHYKGCDPDICISRFHNDDFFAFTDGLDARNYDGGCHIVMDFTPTHWMPLPEPPSDD